MEAFMDYMVIKSYNLKESIILMQNSKYAINKLDIVLHLNSDYFNVTQFESRKKSRIRIM